MSSVGGPEILVLLITALLPLIAIGTVVYLVVRLAIRHEHRNHHEQ
jgi:hypothetical protein